MKSYGSTMSLFRFLWIIGFLVSTASVEAQETKGRNSDTKNAPLSVSWSRLAPENGRPFNDPFTKMSTNQLSNLSFVVRIQRLIAEEKIQPDGVDAKEAKTVAQKLEEEGVDIDWLMTQRKRVLQVRKLQVESLSKSIVKSLGEKQIALIGYVIPIKVSHGKLTEFFLVSTSAACSNEAAPSRLKVVFVSNNKGIDGLERGAPVRVTGRIEAQTTTKLVRIGIGVSAFQSAYTMSSPNIEVQNYHRKVKKSAG